MAVYVGPGKRSTRYVGAQSSPAPYVGAGVLFAPEYSTPQPVGPTPFVSGTTSVTVAFGASGRVAGDLLIIEVETANQAVTTPSGWSIGPSSPQSTGTASAAGAVRLSTFYKISDGTETSVTVAVTGGNHTTAQGFVTRGIDAATPFHASAGQTQAATTSFSFLGLTTTIPNTLIMNCVANDRDAASTTNLTSITNASLGSLTKQFDQTVTTGVGGGVALITGTKAVAGTVSATTATNAASNTNASITYAIAPGASGLITSLYFDTSLNLTGRTLSNSNKTITASNNSNLLPAICQMLLDGEDYVEITLNTVASGETEMALGIINALNVANMFDSTTNKIALYQPSGSDPGTNLIPAGGNVFTGHSWTSGDVFQIRRSTSAQTIAFNLNNGTWTSDYSTSGLGLNIMIAVTPGQTNTSKMTVNGGASAFKYTPPAGFTGPEPATPPPADGWNTTALEASGMTFSNGNKTVVGNNSGGTGDNRCLSQASKSSGKWFASISIDAYEYGDVSITDASDANYVHFAWDGAIYSSTGSTLANIGGYTAPCVIDVSFDVGSHLVWFRVNGGNWNGNALYDPDAGLGGFALPSTSTEYHVKVQIPYYPASQRTLNTGTSTFTYTPPITFPPLQP